MTETRGRVLIISNKYEWTNQRGELVWRKGADIDHQNMKRMFESFGFIVSGEHKNYTSKVQKLTIIFRNSSQNFWTILLIVGVHLWWGGKLIPVIHMIVQLSML